jgi:hypothetical protein
MSDFSAASRTVRQIRMHRRQRRADDGVVAAIAG